jgi:hypothetical protein
LCPDFPNLPPSDPHRDIPVSPLSLRLLCHSHSSPKGPEAQPEPQVASSGSPLGLALLVRDETVHERAGEEEQGGGIRPAPWTPRYSSSPPTARPPPAGGCGLDCLRAHMWLPLVPPRGQGPPSAPQLRPRPSPSVACRIMLPWPGSVPLPPRLLALAFC